jgi:hypothetical protein
MVVRFCAFARPKCQDDFYWESLATASGQLDTVASSAWSRRFDQALVMMQHSSPVDVSSLDEFHGAWLKQRIACSASSLTKSPMDAWLNFSIHPGTACVMQRHHMLWLSQYSSCTLKPVGSLLSCFVHALMTVKDWKRVKWKRSFLEARG